MMCIRWWSESIIYWKLIENDRNVDAKLYSSQLDRVQVQLRKNSFRHLLWNRDILQQDNARPHVTRRTSEKITELGSLIHARTRHCYKRLTSFLVAATFLGRKTIYKNGRSENASCFTSNYLFYFKTAKKFYRRGIEKLPKKWQKIIESSGAYLDQKLQYVKF